MEDLCLDFMGVIFVISFAVVKQHFLNQSQVKPCDPMVTAPNLPWAFLTPKVNFPNVTNSTNVIMFLAW